jgi:hypothetical protein
MTTKRLAERAKQASGEPSPADIAEARQLFGIRKEFLSDQLSSNVSVKFQKEPDWNSWAAFEEFFDAYHAALVDLDNALAKPMAKIRLQGT